MNLIARAARRLNESDIMADLPGLAEACATLAEGRPVIVPCPSPMTYGIVGPDAAGVNALKGRPREQSVGMCVHDTEWPAIAPALDVPDAALPTLVDMLRARISVLAPLRPGAAYPAWIEPAVQDGNLAMFRAYWEPTARLWDRFPRLFGSSGNRTGRPAAASAAEAWAMFGHDAPVIDGDALRDLTVPHTPSTFVRVARDGAVTMFRPGAQDAEVTRYTS